MLTTFFLKYSVFIVSGCCYTFLFYEWYYRKVLASKYLIKPGELISRYVLLHKLKTISQKNKRDNKCKK